MMGNSVVVFPPSPEMLDDGIDTAGARLQRRDAAKVRHRSKKMNSDRSSADTPDTTSACSIQDNDGNDSVC
jgi:hypothetical protein